MTFPIFITLTKTADKGTIPEHKIFEGYAVKGWVWELPKVLSPFTVLRTERNSLVKLGLMSTTPIVALTVDGDTCTFETANSVYTLTRDPDMVWDPASPAAVLAEDMRSTLTRSP